MTVLSGKAINVEFPGWEADQLDGLTLTVTIGGEQIRLATVTYDAEHGLYRRTSACRWQSIR